jgi:hypothetical protein
MDGAVEAELREPLGFARAGAIARAPEQALGLLLPERTTVDGGIVVSSARRWADLYAAPG